MAQVARDCRLMTETLHELTRRGLVSKFSENASFDKASIDQVLADTTACEAIETMLKNAGVKEPLKGLPRETQRQAVAAFMVLLEKLKGE
jgi:hypothetical protein